MAHLRIHNSQNSTVDTQEVQGKLTHQFINNKSAIAHTGPSQTHLKVKENTVSTNLCYCVPEFSNLDIAHLPETNDLLRELAAKLDCASYTNLKVQESDREMIQEPLTSQ